MQLFTITAMTTMRVSLTIVILRYHLLLLLILPYFKIYYYNEYHEGLVELAKGFLKLLLNQLVDKTMVAVREGNRR